jgi:LmbE family N-acetylglucosaminyl deacetylase
MSDGRSQLHLGAPAGRPLRVLVVGAHSDDIEIGCGGTMLALARRARTRVHWVVFSGAGEREQEARRSARRFLGSKANAVVQVHGFRDGFFPAQWTEIKMAFEELARAAAPDVVLTHCREDRHQDHRVLSDLAWNTFRRSLILEYEIPKWDGDLRTPNLYVPLTPAIARRKARLLMEGFGTQRAKRWFTEDTFLGLMRLRGIECGAPMAEGFHNRKATLQLG